MLFFKSNIRFRQEESFIMVCDCKNLIDFELPLYLEPLLKALEKGYDESNPLGLANETEAISDFKEMEMVSDTPNQTADANTDIWSALQYSETEFYS